jgi:hypothetical protein
MGSLYYTGQKLKNKKDGMDIDEHNFTPDLPEFQEEAVRHEEDATQFRDSNFSYVLI